MKTLVVYYSLEGNTKQAAKTIADKLQTELLQLRPLKDLNVKSPIRYLIGGMGTICKLTPELDHITIDVSSYDRIVLGTPIWNGTYVPAINSFLKQYSVHEKVTDVFTCSGGGDNDKCIQKLSKILPNMKTNVALADRNNKKFATENDAKLNTFIEGIKHGN